MTEVLHAGFIALIDAAPLIVARDLGFAREEGLDLQLHRAPSWSTLRDWLALGRIDAAHMLSPVPVATALGLGGMPVRLDVLSVMSVNGSVIGVSRMLADQLRGAGWSGDFADAELAGKALMGLGKTLRIGVPFPFSMHAELLYYWLESLGMRVPQELDVRTVPPSLMAEAIAAGEVDAFCVGEPWGSIAVENGVGELVLPGSAIWSRSPDKVLAVRHDWAEAQPEITGRLLRAMWRAARWLGDLDNRSTAADMVTRPGLVEVSSEIAERALMGRLMTSPRGELRTVPGFVSFHRGGATFPWRSQGAWIGGRMAARTGLERAGAIEAAQAVFRDDLYRLHLAPAGADLPRDSSKIEGATRVAGPIPSAQGSVVLVPDAFFDSKVFDPAYAG